MPLTRTLAAALTGAALALAPLAAAPAAAASASTARASVAVWPGADADDFTFDSFHADYTLTRDEDRDARLSVVETIVARFPDADQNHGIERAIPTRYGDASLDLEVTSVTDASGEPRAYSSSEDSGFLRLRIGDADRYVHGEQSYLIAYTARNAIRDFADTGAQEFYWDVNGTGWAQPFDTVGATVELGRGLAGALTGSMACYQGAEGGTARCAIERDGDTIAARSTAPLGPYETVTVAIGFERGTFARQFVLSEQWYMIALTEQLPWLTPLALLALLTWAIAARATTVKDAPGRPTIIAEYTPPGGMDPLLAAELLGRPERGLPAQLVAFAVSHHVRLVVDERARASKRYRVVRTVNPVDDLPENERASYDILFGGPARRQELSLDPDDHDLGDRVALLRARQAAELGRLGWTAKLAPRGAKPIGRIMLVLFLWHAALVAATMLLGMPSLAVILSGVLAIAVGIAVAAAKSARRRLTAKGAKARDHLLGLREYIRLAEADRMRVLQGPRTAERIDVGDREAIVRLGERLLPYAMVFGLEREWVGELSRDYAQAPPSWLEGSDLAGVAVFASVAAATAFTPTPSSSGSGSSWSGSGGSSSFGGSSGGGFSGGGGGGGGGGGW